MSAARAIAIIGTGTVLLLTGCSSNAPGVDDPSSAATYTDAEARDVLIDESGDPIPTLTLAEWYAEASEQAPDTFDPASCRNSVSPVLLYDRDADQVGTIYRPATIEREYDGATVTAAQFVRVFATDAEAAGFVEAFRADRAACREFEIEGTRVVQGVIDGDFAVDAVGFTFDVAAPDGSTNGALEWMLRDGNLVIALDGVGASVEVLAPLSHRIAEEYAARLSE